MIEYGKEITTKSYYAGELSSTKYEYEQTVISDQNHILKDIIEAIALLNNGVTNKMTIELKVDAKKSYHLKKRWTI